jgi:hypothetical protein
VQDHLQTPTESDERLGETGGRRTIEVFFRSLSEPEPHQFQRELLAEIERLQEAGAVDDHTVTLLGEKLCCCEACAETAATGDRLERLRTARPAWSRGAPAAAVGAHAMRDGAFVAETRRRVEREREHLRSGLAARGFDVAPSTAPFLLCNVRSDPADLLGRCREHGVVLRDATTFRGLDSHVRVAVRDRESTEALFDALDA